MVKREAAITRHAARLHANMKCSLITELLRDPLASSGITAFRILVCSNEGWPSCLITGTSGDVDADISSLTQPESCSVPSAFDKLDATSILHYMPGYSISWTKIFNISPSKLHRNERISIIPL